MHADDTYLITANKNEKPTWNRNLKHLQPNCSKSDFLLNESKTAQMILIL